MIVSFEEAAAFIDDASLASKQAFKDTCEMADMFVKQHCYRQFEFGTYTEVLDGTGSNYLLLNEDPIALVRSVYINLAGVFGEDSLVESDAYHIEGRRLIYHGSMLPYPKQFVGRLSSPVGAVAKVTYDAGYYPVDGADTPKLPADLRWVVKTIIGVEWQRGPGRELLASESLGDYSYQRLTSLGSPLVEPFPYDPRIKVILDKYLRIQLG